MTLTNWIPGRLRGLKLLLTGVCGAATLIFMCATAAAQFATTSQEVSLHAAPSRKPGEPSKYTAGKRIGVVPKGAMVSFTPDPQRGSFFKVRLADRSVGWIHGRYLVLPENELAVTVATFGPEAAGAPAFPSCGPERHYRWKQKITTSGFSKTPTSPSVGAALSWRALSFVGHDRLSWCRDRDPRETKAFSITGWVRRTRAEDDGDVHIEITQKPTDSTGDCFVVEIPAAELSRNFDKARRDLATLLSVAQLGTKDFDSPTRVKFTGLAFWDGWHATADLPINHGRCNSTKGAAWELHPVFKVSAP